MPTTPQHTPTPWRRRGVYIETEARELVAAVRYMETDAETNANAAFVVRAVNAHASLVAVARGAAPLLEQAGYPVAARAARAALALAEGRES